MDSASKFIEDMKDLLDGYTDEVRTEVKASVKKIANSCKNDIKKNADCFGADYAKSWKATKTVEDEDEIAYILHATKGQYRLVHLLENGHSAKPGQVVPIIDDDGETIFRRIKTSEVAGKAHVRPAFEKAEKDLIIMIRDTL